MEGSHPGTGMPHVQSGCARRGISCDTCGWMRDPEGCRGWDQRQTRRTFSTVRNSAGTLHVGNRARCLHAMGSCEHCPASFQHCWASPSTLSLLKLMLQRALSTYCFTGMTGERDFSSIIDAG